MTAQGALMQQAVPVLLFFEALPSPYRLFAIPRRASLPFERGRL